MKQINQDIKKDKIKNKQTKKARWATASVTQTAEKYHDLNLF